MKRSLTSVRVSAMLAGLLLSGCSEPIPPPPPPPPPPAAVITSLVALTPTSISGIVGENVSDRPSLTIRDQRGDAMAGVSVQFSVTSGGGSVTGASTTSNSSGIATVGSWRLGSTPGSNTLVASVGTLTVSFSATGNAGTPRVTTHPAVGLTTSLVRLYGSFNIRGSPTQVWFRHGTDPTLAAYTETQKLGPYDRNLGIGWDISGLPAGTKYYYKMFGENAIGRDSGSIVGAVTSTPPATTIFTQSGIARGLGESYIAQIQVPSGVTRLEVVAPPGTGNADLFVRHATAPTTSIADCSSQYFSAATTEICAMDNPQAGTWFVMLYGAEAFTGVGLTVKTYAGAVGVSVTMSPVSASMPVGGTQQFTASVTGSSNTGVTWSSSNSGIASVTSTGNVTAAAAGQATITAASAADPTKSASAQVTVTTSGTQYTLTVSTIGTGTGSVTSSPIGPSYNAGTVVALTATPSGNSTFGGWSGACTGSTPTCSVTMTANRTVTATFTAPTGVAAFDGTYVGRYIGNISGFGSVTDVVIFRVSNGVLTLNEPGTGSGTVSSSGAGNFNGTIGGLPCQYTGTFQPQGTGASGTWICSGSGTTGSGTWSTVRQSPTSAFIPNGVWIYASWSTATTSNPDDRQSTTDPALSLGSHCPATQLILKKRLAGTVAEIVAEVLCNPSPVRMYSCVGSGSPQQPAQPAGDPLQTCAVDPLATEGSRLRSDALVYTGPGVVTFLYRTTLQLDLKVFYCKPGTVLVAPPRSLRLHCA